MDEAEQYPPATEPIDDVAPPFLMVNDILYWVSGSGNPAKELDFDLYDYIGEVEKALPPNNGNVTENNTSNCLPLGTKIYQSKEDKNSLVFVCKNNLDVEVFYTGEEYKK